MGLQRVNTAYFEVVNTSDPDVSGVGERGENEWVAVSEATVGPEATKVRIRALSRREFDAIPLSDDGKMLGALVDAAVHEADRPLISGAEPIPWHFQRTLGALVYKVSTNPFAATK
jgi:hypothetical protein